MAGILKKVFRVFNGTDWDKYHFETDSEQVIHGDTTVKASIDELNSNLVTKIAGEIKHVTLNSGWTVVSNDGYYLLAAYNIKNDTSYPVTAIQKRSAGDAYTVVVSGTNNSEIDLYLIWCKK